MKRINLLIASCWIAALSGCGVDYGAIVADAHDLQAQAKLVIDSQCDPAGQTGVCVKLHDASVVSTNLLQIADFALSTGTDLESTVKTAWSFAKSLSESVKTLLGIKAIPALSTAAAVPVPPGVVVVPAEVVKP